MADDRLKRILAALNSTGTGGSGPGSLCAVAADVLGVSGAGVMLMSGETARGSLCSTNDVSRLIEDLQYTLGEGPCVDAYKLGQVVAEPDLAEPDAPRWLAFSAKALGAGARAVFGFPLQVGAARLGALNLYQDQPGRLSDDQHADALVMADVVARWVIHAQADSPPDALASAIESGSEFYLVVHNAAGAVSVQLGVSITEAMIRLRAYAFTHDRLVLDVAKDVVSRKLRFE